MSKRSEEKAREYEDSLDYYHYTSDNPSVADKAGYEQAEKDIALTWEDIKNLDYLMNDVEFENKRADTAGKDIPFNSDESFYGEVLKRFNKKQK